MKTPVVLACALALVLAGCTKSSDTSTTSTSSTTTTDAGASPGATAAAQPNASGGGKTIGVSIQNREAQFYQDMERGMKDEAAKYGYTVNVVDASATTPSSRAKSRTSSRRRSPRSS